MKVCVMRNNMYESMVMFLKMIFPALVFLGLKTNDCCGCCGNESCGQRFAVRSCSIFHLPRLLSSIHRFQTHTHTTIKKLCIILFSFLICHIKDVQSHVGVCCEIFFKMFSKSKKYLNTSYFFSNAIE